MEIQVRGLSRDLFSFATALTVAGEKGLLRELDVGLRGAANVVAHEIESDDRNARFPDNYARTFNADLSVKPQVRAVSAHRISIVAVGKSGPKGRDVKALDAGRLRKPVFGRSRRLKNGGSYKNPWVLQQIGAGWFSDPFERARPAALAQIQAAVDRTADKINRRT